MISPRMNYGMKTVFAYMHEYLGAEKRVSKQNYDESIKITLSAAEFSYALLPSFFKNIIGVTGTLKTMSSFQKR